MPVLGPATGVEAAEKEVGGRAFTLVGSGKRFVLENSALSLVRGRILREDPNILLLPPGSVEATELSRICQKSERSTGLD